MSHFVRTERRGEVAAITLARPERRNAMSREMLAALRERLSGEVAAGARAVTLGGAGGTFSGGADLADLEGTIEDARVDEEIERSVAAIRDAPVPVIAAIEGGCVGAAVDLALACDVRVASSTAFFQIPATRLGLLYNPRAVVRMRRLLGAEVLSRLLLLGERIEAEDALQCGLVSRLAPAGAALEDATSLAERVTGNVRGAVAASKALLVALEREDADLRRWNGVRARLLDSSDRREALARAKTAPHRPRAGGDRG